MRGDAELLMRVVDGEGNLGAARLRDDVPCAAGNQFSPAVAKNGRQRHVVDEVDIEKEVDLAFAEVAFGRKEPPVERLRAGPPDGGKHLVTVARPQRADLQRRAIAQAFASGVLGSIHGGGPSSLETDLDRQRDCAVCLRLTRCRNSVACSLLSRTSAWSRM